MATKTKLVRGALVGFSSERTQYKPYGYNLDFTQGPQQVLIELDVPAEYVLDENEVSITLSMDGLMVMLEQAADKMDELHNNFLNRYSR